MPYSDEELARRSAKARELHAQVLPDGRRKFGGPQPGSGRPRKKRAAEIVAEEAKAEAKALIAALRDSLDPAQPASVRLQAAKQWLDIENKEASLQLQEDREDRELAKMPREDLLALVGEKFLAFAGAGALDSVMQSQLEPPEDEDVLYVEDEGSR